jgi:HK97 family phage portal protein
MLPEITDRVKGFLARREQNARPLSLELKGLSAFVPSWSSWDYARGGFPNLAAAYGADLPSLAGVAVTRETALNHSAVWACNRLISESIGMIPCVMMRDHGGIKRPCDGETGNPSHPLYGVMHDQPNEEITATGFQEMLTSHCLLEGNAYAHILRRSGTQEAMELSPLLPSQVHPDREKTGQKRLVYVVDDINKTYTLERGKPHDILHIRGLGWDGIKGYSVIQTGRQSMGSAIAGERHVARFWANGGRTPYTLSLERDFNNDQDFEKFRADWERVYAEPNRAPILPKFIKEYTQIGRSMVESQVLESRLFSIHEICRWFLVSPHLVGDLSRATFSNIEQLALEFVKMTLSTWINRWEQELRRCVLTPAERAAGFCFRHDLKALLRGDFASRMAGYAMLLDKAVASPDEVRDLEDWDPIPNGAGKAHHIQLAMATLPGTGDPMPVEAKYAAGTKTPQSSEPADSALPSV